MTITTWKLIHTKCRSWSSNPVHGTRPSDFNIFTNWTRIWR